MRKIMIALLLLAAHLNLTALVPLQPGDASPPWWVGGRLLWPFAVETRTLLGGDLLNTITPILAILAALCFLMAAAALLRRVVPEFWFPQLVVAGALFSIALQLVWFTVWALLPLLVDGVLLWTVLRSPVPTRSLQV